MTLRIVVVNEERERHDLAEIAASGTAFLKSEHLLVRRLVLVGGDEVVNAPVLAHACIAPLSGHSVELERRS